MRKFSSLCCGCGGFDLGFVRAGFACAAAYDKDRDAVALLSRNLPHAATAVDIMDPAFDGTALKASPIIIAGPPCQGFSTAGLMRKGDPRNEVLLRVVDLAIAVRCRILVLENVPAITSARFSEVWEAAVGRLRNAQFRTCWQVVDAASLGVGQTRRRVVLIAWRGRREFEFGLSARPAVTLRGALSGVERLADHRPKFLSPGSRGAMIAAHIRQGQKLSNVRMSAASVHTWDIPDVFGHVTRAERQLLETLLRMRRRDRARDFGDADPVLVSDLSRTLGRSVSPDVDSLIRKGYIARKGRRIDLRHTFNGKYRRLSWDRPSHTVDTHFGDPSMFLHPDQSRGFSAREAARIQGFPDSFSLSGTERDFRLIGNAVPPPLSEAVAQFVSNSLL